MNWIAFADEIWHKFGASFLPDQVADPDWCVKEMARRGYSCQITTITADVAMEKFQRVGRTVSSPGVNDFLRQIKENGGAVYSFQLQGPNIANRGAHPSPHCETLQQCAAIALFNVLNMQPAK